MRVKKPPIRRAKTLRAEKSHTSIDKKRRNIAGQIAAQEPDVQTTVIIKDAAAVQQPENKHEVENPIMNSFNEGMQVVKLEQCLKNEDLSLQAGWAAERRVRGNGWDYDVYYHAPPGFIAAQGSRRQRVFRSMMEVVHASKMALEQKSTPQQTSTLHGRQGHACAAAAVMESCVARDTSSSHTAYGSAVSTPSPQPGEIIVLSDSDTGSSDKEDVMVHEESGAAGLAAGASAPAQRRVVQPSWQAAVRAAFLRGCSEQMSMPHIKRRQ